MFIGNKNLVSEKYIQVDYRYQLKLFSLFFSVIRRTVEKLKEKSLYKYQQDNISYHKSTKVIIQFGAILLVENIYIQK